MIKRFLHGNTPRVRTILQGEKHMRESGILMHITSLPGPYGVGTIGRHAYEFVDFLKEAGQSCWQILPLNPTGYGDSPYQSCSAFAGNHYLIDLEALTEQGLLERVELESIVWNTREDKVDFGLLHQNRLRVLRRAFDRFTDEALLDSFCRKHNSWLPDFALYMALKEENSGKPWYRWNKLLKTRDPDAMWEARQRLKKEIRFYCFIQYLFYNQWMDLHRYANENGIFIIGDVPVYVPLDSVEVWSDPELFQLDEELTPTNVAGCPPDAFTEDGQLWGNPLYRWDVMAKDGYRWWIRRLTAAGALYDRVRLDHFRGFEAYWSVPYGDETARNGKWVKGPAMDFINAIKTALPELNLIAEDLGFLTPEVLQMRDKSGFPGMKVLEFAFDSSEPSDYLPHTYIQNTVCYTGTHDNMTVGQWLKTIDKRTLDYATQYMQLAQQEGFIWGVIRTAYACVSNLCIIQMQDCLELGEEARMNFPGTVGSNWTWRALPGSFNHTIADRLCRMAALYGRGKRKNFSR